MHVNIDIRDEYNELSVTIHAQSWSMELDQLMKRIKHPTPERIIGTDQEQTILIEPENIDFIYAEKRKVYARIHNQDVELKMKLYELENLLEPFHFARFSKSVLGNTRMIQKFEVAFNGNLCVHFKSGNKEYVTRNYVVSLKQKLLGGDGNGR
ncbi:LytTR family DNA-binding domain-containing protein [Pontibacillus yanchengensis]|uniref:Response regulator, LytTR family protein n=1 Tax=Pontibacillus yanchengensis Y32 TaxID=1385514 RepID=A0A0A2TA49_9BACI|nr:LytTR family DNA-binding domain-containing protein [Pontibacillus yanchengensis]KGP72707.1 response regulator, LytTR family protein [Pontibacillus yanchengensis Y32]